MESSGELVLTRMGGLPEEHSTEKTGGQSYEQGSSSDVKS